MDTKLDVLTLGEVMLRLSPPRHEKLQKGLLLEKSAAGAELNVAAGLAQLGLSAAIATKLPDNDLSRFVLAQARAAGVRDDAVVFDRSNAARLGVYYYEGASAPRKPAVIYDRRASSVNSLTPDEVPRTLYGSCRLFHTTGITLGLGGQAQDTAIELIRRTRIAGCKMSFDVNYRANLWDDQEARAVIEPLLPLFDVLFISEETARRMFRRQGALQDIMAGFSHTYGIGIIATTARTVLSPTHHTFTSTVYDAARNEFFTEAPYDIDVVDRVGSGDAFVAGALYGLLRHGSALKAMAYGNAMAACKCTVAGDLPSTSLAEIDKLIAQHAEGGGGEMDR